MSAFILSDEHINALIFAAMKPGKNHGGPLSWYSWPHWHDTNPKRFMAGHERSAVDIGNMLAAENERSVAFRYHKDADTLPPWTFKRPNREFSPVEIIKAVQCYEYQSCETPGWSRSEAHQFCKSLLDRTISDLPGWSEAPWGIEAGS